MDNQKYERTLDGAKLLEWMYENGHFSLQAADMIADEMEKGTFDKIVEEKSHVDHDNALLRIFGELRDSGVQLTEEKVDAVVD